MNIPIPDTPRAYSSLTQTQLAMLDQWVDGQFDDDWGQLPVYTNSDQVPLAEQGDMLTRAAMEFCLADAFHPGCEMTWPMRAPTMYMEPFRLAHAPQGWVEPGLGEILTAGGVTIPNGPLYGQLAGGVTRWMAVPWQTDTASCRSGYEPAYDPYVPTFWPARVPNEVLAREDYAIVVDPTASTQDRLAAFARRSAWIQPLGTVSYTDQINNMIRGFDHLGVVEVNPGPADEPGQTLFPALIQVEDQHIPISIETPGKATLLHGNMTTRLSRTAQPDLTGIEKVRRFPNGLRR